MLPASRVGTTSPDEVFLRLACRLSIAFLLLAVPPARAQDGAGTPDLDRLLKLPGSVEYTSEKKGGATRSEWRQRFHDAEARVTGAETALDKAQKELAETVGAKSEWQFTPPGLPAQASDADSSSAFLQRQEVKKQREELARARARLRELGVEANLAGVPDSWRGQSTDVRSNHPVGDDPVTGPAARR